MTAPTDLGSRAALERARLQVAMAGDALGHWHRGDECTGGKPYPAYRGDAVTAIDAALRALHDARAALITEGRHDEDAHLARIDALIGAKEGQR